MPTEQETNIKLQSNGKRSWCLFVCLAVMAISCQTAKLPDKMNIEVSVTPGNPGARSEVVKLSYENKNGSLTVESRFGTINTQSETVTLSAKDLKAVWNIVISENLFNFRPKARGGQGQVFDFESKALKIDARRQGSNVGENNGKSHLEVSWDAPITNEDAVKKLFSAVGTLATKNCHKVKLNSLR